MLVFEDLHWADEALLSFLEHLADWAEGVPLLLLCTARPELYERHPGFGANARNAQRINLAPLTDEETARLIAALLERAVLPAETQQALLERAGGNPLYAEEFVRLLADRGGAGRGGEVPDSVQALIAARLDTLSPERKSLLQDAAVLGKVFWAGALAQMGGREPREVEQRPARARPQGARARRPLAPRWRASTSTASGTCSCGTSATGRSRVPPAPPVTAPRQRGSRRRRASASQTWPTSSPTTTCRRWSSRARPVRPRRREELEAPAIRYLGLAGERALSLDVDRAEQHLARALDLAPAGRPRARLAARALGPGRPAAAPAAGSQAGARTGARPLPASRASRWPPAAS